MTSMFSDWSLHWISIEVLNLFIKTVYKYTACDHFIKFNLQPMFKERLFDLTIMWSTELKKINADEDFNLK